MPNVSESVNVDEIVVNSWDKQSRVVVSNEEISARLASGKTGSIGSANLNDMDASIIVGVDVTSGPGGQPAVLLIPVLFFSGDKPDDSGINRLLVEGNSPA